MSNFVINLKSIQSVWQKQNSEMGEICGISNAQYVSHRTGRIRPSPEILITLEKLTGIPVRRLYEDVIDNKEINSKPRILYQDQDSISQVNERPPQYFDKNSDVYQILNEMKQELELLKKSNSSM